MVLRLSRATALSLCLTVAVLPASAYADQRTAESAREDIGTGKAAHSPDTGTPASGSILKTMWTADNTYGHASSWIEQNTNGDRTRHFLFTGADGAIIELTRNRAGGRLLLPSGEIQFKQLSNGNLSFHVFSKDGCGTGSAYGPGGATLVLDASGQPVGDSSAAKAAQYALACASTDIAKEFLNFAAVAGVSTASQSGRAHVEGSWGCMLADAGLVLAFAAWAIAPFDILAYAGFMLAWASYEDSCMD